ncbi:MAG: DNA repair protein RecO, partial [bacterium]
VLKSQRQGETSKILTLYTRRFGKLTVIAKGARSARSKFGGSLEPLNYVATVFYEKENREIQFLSQADILNSFAKINASLERTALAMAACELVNRLEIGVAPSPILFKLLLEVLEALNRPLQKPHNCLRAFQVRLLDVLGIRPNLDACKRCERPGQDRVALDIAHGGFICERCQGRHTPGLQLNSEAFAALRVFQQEALADVNGYLPSSAAQQQVDELLLTYLRFHIEGFTELNALKFLKKIVAAP